jgi:Rieske Fe-S protein
MDSYRRRDFMIAAAAAAATVIGWRRVASAATSEPTAKDVIDAGPISDYPDSDVYDKYRQDGAFVIRRDKQIFALSSICTHKGCKVRVADDLSFYCKCHHSTFDKDGHVTRGPAKRDLPRLGVAEDARAHLLINLDGVPPPDGA